MGKSEFRKSAGSEELSDLGPYTPAIIGWVEYPVLVCPSGSLFYAEPIPGIPKCLV